MRLSYHNETVTVLRAAEREDRYGNTELDWDNPDSHDIGNCRLTPVKGSEIIDSGGQRVITQWLLDCPYEADLKDADRVKKDGRVYLLDGPVGWYPSPSMRLAHGEATLKRSETS